MFNPIFNESGWPCEYLSNNHPDSEVALDQHQSSVICLSASSHLSVITTFHHHTWFIDWHFLASNYETNITHPILTPGLLTSFTEPSRRIRRSHKSSPQSQVFSLSSHWLQSTCPLLTWLSSATLMWVIPHLGQCSRVVNGEHCWGGIIATTRLKESYEDKSGAGLAKEKNSRSSKSTTLLETVHDEQERSSTAGWQILQWYGCSISIGVPGAGFLEI